MDMLSQQSKEPPANQEEHMLLPRHVKGDKTAFPLLMQAYQRPIYSYLVHSGISETARDDLFQEIFLKIHKSAALYNPKLALKPWLFTVVANMVRSHYRKSRVEEIVFPEEMIDDSPGTQATLFANETARLLDQEIAKLPQVQREVILLFCLEEMSLKEIAKILGHPLGTIKTHLHRGRKTLTASLIRRKNRRSSHD